MPDLRIANGLIIDPASGLEARRDLLVRRGKVAAIIPPRSKTPTARIIDAAGCWVVPGLIDMHVHLRDPGTPEDETLETGTRAAAAGGVTTVLAMANTRPVIDTPQRVRRVRAHARRRAVVNVLVAGAVTRGLRGERLTALEQLAAAGVAAFSDDGRPVMNAELMRQALLRARRLNLPVLDHAEDDHLTGDGVMHAGRRATRLGLPGIPAAAETLMAMRDIALAELTGGRLHICHVSCAGTVQLIRKAKKRGAPVTGEAAPHHFTLTDADIPRAGADYKMKPPLRGRADRKAIIAGLADGTLDAIATDHAPHAPAKKARGLRTAPFGIIGLETLLPLSLALVRRGQLTRRRLIELLSAAPAAILGLKTKGHLRPHRADADITIIDPQACWRAPRRGASRSRNTPFAGRRLRGRARATIVGGEVVHLQEAVR
ncbi:MAG: dihydroorotase [Elusimicrobiota bacterium]